MIKYYLFLLSGLFFLSGRHVAIGEYVCHQFLNEAEHVKQNVAVIKKKYHDLDKCKLASDVNHIFTNLHFYNPKR